MPAKSKAQIDMMRAKCAQGDQEMCRLAKEFDVSAETYSDLPRKKGGDPATDEPPPPPRKRKTQRRG